MSSPKKAKKPICVSAIADDCTEFVLASTHMRPRHNKKFVRCIGRQEVLVALNHPSLEEIICSDTPKGKERQEWVIRHNSDGSITVGCTKFPKKSVDKIKKWAAGANQ